MIAADCALDLVPHFLERAMTVAVRFAAQPEVAADQCCAQTKDRKARDAKLSAVDLMALTRAAGGGGGDDQGGGDDIGSAGGRGGCRGGGDDGGGRDCDYGGDAGYGDGGCLVYVGAERASGCLHRAGLHLCRV